ncbi:recombinase family protein [Citrobacter sp. Cb010]|uniref:recombinase family protein n=1 Tax=unclassified Citrobacter TaxID=2644389 RepID=UPI00257544C3|nr:MULTISPECIES: recombinase family protein [unclassified Citrobacter]MDM3376226.1 recombinase family protein [Citrobacter sp. Cb010]MDM3459439.1 recombinase family protein [Citrobacter sp. Cb036]
MTKRLYSYIRWSTDKQTGNTSMDRQTEKARKFAALHKLEYSEILDAGVSAFRGKNTTQGALAGFIKAVEAGVIPSDSWLYVENLDRLTRQDVMTALNLFTGLLQLGLTIVTGMDGKIYSEESVKNNVTDLMLSLFLFSRANEESLTKQKRAHETALKLIDRHRSGLPVNIKSAGSAPWWIDASMGTYEAVKPHPVHFKAAKEAVRLLLSGWGCFRVTEYLNQNSEVYPPPKGNRGKGMKRAGSGWVVANLKAMRKNRALYGEKEITIDGVTHRLSNYFPPVCSQSDYARLQEIAECNRMPQGEEKKIITLLSGMGILRCGHCGGSMSYFSKEGRIRYVCETGKNRSSTCRVWSVSGQLVERCLLAPVVRGYMDLMMGKHEHGEDLKRLLESKQGELQGIEDQIANITKAITLGGNIPALVASLQTLEHTKDGLLVELDRIAQREAVQSTQAQQIESMVDVFELLTPAILTDVTDPNRLRLREVVRSVITSVTLSKQPNKALTLSYELPDKTRYVYGGVLSDGVKSYQLTVENNIQIQGIEGTPQGDEAIERVREAEITIDQKVGEILGSFPPLNPSHFFGKR